MGLYFLTKILPCIFNYFKILQKYMLKQASKDILLIRNT
jgi:hypothetical protein